jgi:2-(1,2-epoxy-1,2-dihydrophenyl)acetyl-CoA isomerase
MAVEAAGAVLTERDGAVLVLTMNRPDRLNALARPLREAMHAALVDAMGDDGVRAIVLTGAGRAFSAGGDLDELTTVDDLSAEVRQGFNPLARFLAEGPKPVVAAINGPAAGAGFGLALCCDLRVMADDAFVAVAFAGIGLVPDTGVSWTLPRLVGPSRAYDLAVTGRRVQAEEAERIGLADRVVPRDEVVSAARSLAADLARGPRAALAATKQLLRESTGRTLAEALEAEAVTQAAAAAHADFAEGVAAFRERRSPNFA